ncbi:helix-turn-helix domain-containing protein [Micromonospora sp. CPCC 206061]|uniref:helix-turn-helix domain-containing protein n=1 Tax=Micromonospora sp. CPCC 206061 TaxID=3122410 RepID=UPI003FA5E629
MTKATATLDLAQTAVTTQLSRIERSLGGALFDRPLRHLAARPPVVRPCLNRQTA